MRVRLRKQNVSFVDLFLQSQVILAIASMWLLCGILTWTNALPDDKDTWGYGARVDIKSQVIKDAKWFRFPYPCKNKISYLKICSL